MKQKRNTICLGVLVLLMTFAVLVSGCGGNSSSQEQDSPAPDSSSQESPAEESSVPDSSEPDSQEESASEMTPAEIADMSEKAMQNFLDRIEKGNYVMNAAGFMKTTVFSDDLVYFDYEDDDVYSDFAVMSVDSEVFQGFFTDDGVRDISYLKEGSAFETSKKKLPNYWLADEISGGNIYNVFYNDQEDPLKFVSYDAGIQNQVRSYVGYGEIALRYMHEVYLTLDAENPSEAHLEAAVDDDEVARYYFDDIDITITFGDAQTDARAESWMQDPSYPDARSGWTEGDIFIFNSIFLPGYGEQAVPYMPFGSYALSIDEENFLTDDAVYIRDPHATEKDIEDYAAVLAANGFEEFTENGETTYRRLLREDTKCYSSISLEYDNGLNATARKAYDFPKYEGLEEINGVLEGLKLAALPETEALTDFTAVDRKWEQTESWLYLYDYYAVLYVSAHYGDYDQVMQYLDAYAETLKADGFTPHYADGDEEGENDYYQSPDESANFRYHFEDDGETVILLYKDEKCLEAAEAEEILTKAGFPEIDFTSYLTGRNTVKFQKTMYGKDYDPSLSLTWRFDAAADAEAFLDQFVAALEEDDYLRVPPTDLGSNKTNGYTNEEKKMGAAFDFIPDENNAETYVYFDFRGGIDFEAEGGNEEEEGNKPILGWKHADEEKASAVRSWDE